MPGYVLIAANDPCEGPEQQAVFELASSLAEARDQVSLYLTDSGVQAARSGDGERWLEPLMLAGVSVFADPFALEEHGISHEGMVSGVVPAPIETLVNRLQTAF